MSRTCKLCGRGPKMDATRSHSHIQAKKWARINLQARRLSGAQVMLCTRCTRTLRRAA